jgi:hypothetical protein
MLLGFFTIVIMGIVAFAHFREGLVTAFAMTCNVFLSGLVAFNFFEPLADALDPLFADNFLHGYEDFLTLVVLFCVTLGLLRWTTNFLLASEIQFHPAVLQGGGAFFGLISGYLTAGILVCALQTLPWHEHFIGFSTGMEDPSAPVSPLRRLLPPDRVWLAMVHRAGLVSLATPDAAEKRATFDWNGSFEQRYARFRRYREDRPALTDHGECPAKP